MLSQISFLNWCSGHVQTIGTCLHEKEKKEKKRNIAGEKDGKSRRLENRIWIKLEKEGKTKERNLER